MGQISVDDPGQNYSGANNVTVLWHRRSQKARVVSPRMTKLADDFLPKLRILHPWPNVRFAVRHQR